MKTRTICFSMALTVLGLTAPFALQACSSDSSPAPGTSNGTDGGSNDSGAITTRPDTSTTTGSGDSSTGNDASQADDTGTPNNADAADIPDGGQPVTPGVVKCGGADCNVSSNTCCVQTDASAACVSGAGATCPGNAASIHCVEAADCPSGQSCCGAFAGAGATTTCAATCPGGVTNAQFCRTNGECKAGERCIIQDCQGQTLELCGTAAHAFCTAK